MKDFYIEQYTKIKLAIEELQDVLSGLPENLDKQFNLETKEIDMLDAIYDIITNKITQIKEEK